MGSASLGYTGTAQPCGTQLVLKRGLGLAELAQGTA